MADATLQILIEAQDKFSITLDSFGKKLDKIANNSKKSTDILSSGFLNTTNSLIRMGNMAATVDNIFSSLQNMELRLENANERLANAQDRVTDSNINLQRATRKLSDLEGIALHVRKFHLENTEFGRKVLDDYTNASERVTDAQKEQERAERGLVISENNLARAQNMVVGMYIQIGIQSLTLATTIFPMLVTALEAVGLAMSLARAAAMGLVIGGLIFLAEKILSMGNKDMWDPFNKEIETNRDWLDKLADSAHASDRAIHDLIETLRDEEGLRAFQLMTGSGQFGGGATAASYGPSVNIPNSASHPLAPGGLLGPALFQPNVQQGGDFILRPNGQMIETDPRDTILAMKDFKGGRGGGIIIEINGPIYGVNAQDISRALLIELRRKITI